MNVRFSNVIFGCFIVVLLLGFLIGTDQRSAASPAGDSGGIINFGQVISGDLNAGEQDTWTFLGKTNQRISLAAERAPRDQATDLDPQVELTAPDGSSIAADNDSGPRRDAVVLGMVLPTDGLYAIKVRDQAGTGSGTYQLTLAENFMPAGCTDFSSTTVTYDWYSPIGRENLRYRVYFPPCYESSGRRYPYIILMHGSNSSDTHWENLGMGEAVTVGVALNRLPPLALVMPYGGEIANTNIFNLNGSYEYVILNEIIPLVEEQYCLRKDGAGRAIGGISRGGFWAYEIGLRHPELFTAIGGHSPVFDLYHAPASHNPLNVIETLAGSEVLPRLYIDRGENDFWMENIDLMPPLLDTLQIPHSYIVNPGGRHDDTYWASQVYTYLAFYSADWTSGLATYPLCELERGGLE